jgi:hypothetical protein
LLQPLGLLVRPLTVSRSHSNSTAWSLAISQDDSSWDNAPENSLARPVKIAFWQLLVPHSRLFAMPLVNLPSSIAAKEIFASVLLSLNVYQVFVTLSQSVHL